MKKGRKTKAQEETGREIKNGQEIKGNNQEREILYRCLFLIKISCTTSPNLPSAPATSTERHASASTLNRNDRSNNVYSPRVNLSLFAGEGGLVMEGARGRAQSFTSSCGRKARDFL